MLRFNYFVFRALDLSMSVTLRVTTLFYKMCFIKKKNLLCSRFSRMSRVQY